MLLVNGFRPIQKTYTNQNPNKSNLKKSHFQSKADSVHFTSVASKATEEADAQVAELTQKYLKEHSDIFGPNFEEKFLKPVNEFLAQHGISIQHTNINFYSIRTHDFCLNSGEVRNASGAYLVNKEGCTIHPYGYLPNEGSIEITANAATARIFDKLVSGKMNIHDDLNPFIGNEFPEELIAISRKVNDTLNDFCYDWVVTRHDNDDKKAQRLQKAFLELMPEK